MLQSNRVHLAAMRQLPEHGIFAGSHRDGSVAARRDLPSSPNGIR